MKRPAVRTKAARASNQEWSPAAQIFTFPRTSFVPLPPCVFLHLFPSLPKTSIAQLKLLLCLWLVCCLGHLYISTFQSNYPKWVSLPVYCPCQIITVSPGAAAWAIKSNVRCLGIGGESALLPSQTGQHVFIFFTVVWTKKQQKWFRKGSIM